jgi:D-glycero-D-manno-heptose 1,7-bisphosphate phosphatase
MALPESAGRAALFLDRDGVINEDVGYCHRKEDVRFLSGIFALVGAANSLRMPVLVVTNQAGIGRGYYTEDDFHRLMAWMGAQFKERGARLDGVYFCPHHPEQGQGAYKTVCQCRKPAPGMIRKAARDHGLALDRSVLVGDSARDMEAGLAAGVGTLIRIVPGGIRLIPRPEAPNAVQETSSLTDIIPLLENRSRSTSEKSVIKEKRTCASPSSISTLERQKPVPENPP